MPLNLTLCLIAAVNGSTVMTKAQGEYMHPSLILLVTINPSDVSIIYNDYLTVMIYDCVISILLSIL